MAGIAVGRKSRILSAAVASLASKRRMGSRKREAGLVVAEVCSTPPRCRVTLGAVLGKSSSGMVGIGRAVVIVRMAGIAVGWKPVVLSAAVAGLASKCRMSSGQRKAGLAVIEACSTPPGCCVALHAVLGITGSDMVGIGCAVVVVRVTGIAVGRHARVLPAAVTGLAA